MILTRSSGLVGLSLLLLAAVPAASATAKAKPRPKVTSVAPMTAGVGDMLTIRGKNFVLGKKRNTVLFRAPNGRVVSAKSVQSTRKVIYVVVPKGIQQYMPLNSTGVAQPTRFRLRVLSKRFAKSFTATSKSPTLGPASTILGPGKVAPVPGKPAVPPDCDKDGLLDSVDGDDDGDLLSDVQEADLKLGRCDADSDGDGIEDGYEVQSARDLNNTTINPLPYPGKRPYPNALDGNDGGSDYDGDGLFMDQEFLLWNTVGPRSLILSYSAGKKSSTNSTHDDNRDADVDNLGNWDEFNGPYQPGWWGAIYGETPYTDGYHGLNAIDSDSDGDGLRDDLDDIDHDGFTNAQEGSRGPLMNQPFNPCLPDWGPLSLTCSNHPPISDPYPPFDVDQDTTTPGLQVLAPLVPWPRPDPIEAPPEP